MKSRHLAYILLLLPVFIVRDYTPGHELKYLSIVDEALENNSWLAFHNHGEPYADKPPLFFWGMMLARWLTGKHLLWLYGLLSLLPAAGIMAIGDKWFYRARIEHDAITSNFLLGTTLMFLGGASVLRMDMLMCFFIVLSLYTFYKMYSGTGRNRDRWLLPVWIFLAVFSKGPVGLLVPLVSIVVFLAVKKGLRTVGRYLGWRQWALMLGLSAVWLLMVYADGGGQYLYNLLFKQTVGRGIDSFHHKEPVYYYAVNLLWMMAPWTLLYIASLWAGFKKRVLSNDAGTLFICVIFSTFCLLSVFSSKVEIYMLPVFPFVAYLSSACIYRLQGNIWIRIGAGIPAALLILAFPATFFADKFLEFEYESLLAFKIALFFLSLGAALSLRYVIRGRVSRAVGLLSFSILLAVALSSFGLPQFNKYLGYRHMAEAGLAAGEKAGAESYSYYNFMRAPNMDVYMGRPLTEVKSLEGIDSLAHGEKRTVLFIQSKEFGRLEGLEQVLGGYEPVYDFYRYRWYILGGDCQ